MHRLILMLCFAAVSGFAAEQDDTDVLKNLDVFELEVAADPQISPDGSRIVYVRRSMDIMSDRPVSNVWIIDVDGDNHRPLLSGSDSYSSPRWSPSGDRIAYVTNVDGRGPQIHVRWMDTGQTALLTNVRRSHSACSLNTTPNRWQHRRRSPKVPNGRRRSPLSRRCRFVRTVPVICHWVTRICSCCRPKVVRPGN